jgi:hypothetical protein
MAFNIKKLAGKFKDGLLDKLKAVKDAVTAKNKTRTAFDWFKSNIKNLLGMNPVATRQQAIKSSNTSKLSSVTIGQMFMFVYDAKWKNELPYWDKFPLSIVVEKYTDGFLGLNLHYLPPPIRAVLLDQLLEYRNTKNLDDTTILKISWGLLRDAAKHPLIYPCVKRYLYSHVQSNYLMVLPSEWEHVIFLPIENFQKKTKEEVWEAEGY